MINSKHREDIEQELAKLGWTNPEWNARGVLVYPSYLPKNEKCWDFTVFCKYPVWEWDFVEYAGHGSYVSHDRNKGDWLNNMRLDFSFAEPHDAVAIAQEMDQIREAMFESDILEYKTVPYLVAIQRVKDRPNG